MGQACLAWRGSSRDSVSAAKVLSPLQGGKGHRVGAGAVCGNQRLAPGAPRHFSQARGDFRGLSPSRLWGSWHCGGRSRQAGVTVGQGHVVCGGRGGLFLLPSPAPLPPSPCCCPPRPPDLRSASSSEGPRVPGLGGHPGAPGALRARGRGLLSAGGAPPAH